MAHISGTLSAVDRLLVALCRNSYRFYSGACFTVMLQTRRGPVTIPLIRGSGLRNLSFDHNPLNPTYKENWIGFALRAIYGYRAGTFVDVGANIGKILISLILHNRDISYIAFEPNIHCCFYINKIIEENHLSCHRLLPIALADHSGVATLTISEDFDVRGSIVGGFHDTPSARPRQILHDRGDRFLACETVAVVKLDVEGSEFPSLLGLVKTIEVSRPIIMVELLDFAGMPPAAAELRCAAAANIAQFLAERDYRLFRITSELELKAVTLQGLENRLHPVENNYIASPANESDVFVARFEQSRNSELN